MKGSQTNDLLQLGDMMHGGYSALISNAGKVIAVITLAMAVLVTFTDATVSDFGGESFTTTLTIMLMSAYLMYFSLEDAGEKEGEESEEYKSALARYLSAKERITPSHIDELRAFCLDYSKRELEYRRLCYLSEMGYSEGDFEKYKSGAKFPIRAVNAFKRAERLRAIKLSPAVLLSRSHGITKGELTNPRGKKIQGALISLIPSTVCMIFTVSIILTAKEGMTWQTVMDGMLKLSALPIVGFKGLIDGYGFAKEDKAGWLEAKARLIESFLEAK